MEIYLKNENQYRSLIRAFLSKQINAQKFVDEFIPLWKADRDNQWQEIEKGEKMAEGESIFCENLNRVFESCDCYCPEPKDNFEINKDQLWKEVREISAKQWGEI